MQVVLYALVLASAGTHADDPCLAVMKGEASSHQACITLEVAKLGDRTVSMAAVQTLSGLAPQSINPLRDALKNGKTAVIKANTADALGRIGPKPPEIAEAVPDLVAALKDEARLVRRQAAGAVGRLGSRAKSALPALIEAALQDADPLVRHLAAFGIDSINKESK